MVSFTILAGGYDVFVAAYLFNSATNSLSLVSKSTTGPSPSWISLHPTNQSILYAVNEVTSGALQSFTVDSAGTLSPAIDTVSSGGNGPAFATALSTGSVAIFNYGSGDGRIVPTNSCDATKFIDSAPTISFPAPLAPSVSHPHMALEHGSEVLVPDLGGDRIWRLAPSAGNYSIQGFIPQPAGSGPRHIAISSKRLNLSYVVSSKRSSDDRLFTLHELTSTLTVQAIPAAPNGTAFIIASASIVPPDPPSGASFAAGEILIPKTTTDFPTPYIYVSNRNVGVQDSRGDAIAIFEHVNAGTDKEGLELVKHVYTGIDQPRGMEFGPADGRGGEAFLAVAGVAGSAGTKIFKRTEGGKNLELVATNLDIPTRTTFVWL
ncbi:hypothetical protein H0H87_012688 [Tephrocybe sp. NHM501043]|nr:hypothetical protein H0H87_012688 [Tephrocybe sp. NHM501043]